jgi:hypothetical protein
LKLLELPSWRLGGFFCAVIASTYLTLLLSRSKGRPMATTEAYKPGRLFDLTLPPGVFHYQLGVLVFFHGGGLTEVRRSRLAT